MMKEIQRVLTLLCGSFCLIGLGACGKKAALDLPPIEEKRLEVSDPCEGEGN